MESRHIKLLRAAAELARQVPDTDFALDGEVVDAKFLQADIEDHLRAMEGLYSETTEWPEPRPEYEDLLAQRQGCQDALRESFEVIQEEREAREKAEAERDQLLMVFGHTHVVIAPSERESGDDTCAKCGLDLRHPIHRTRKEPCENHYKPEPEG